jgi:hypothetical protein
MLYVARWNVPRAALHCGIPTNEMMEVFRNYVSSGKLPPQE